VITTNELKLVLTTITNNKPPVKIQDIYWLQGATDLINLLIRKSQEKEDSTPHYSFN